ncbi:metal ABC transporter substrate-binding protein [Demequina pelophila]|uniref:metal ABC transporter substrate-binding protein n=1 Tax=Demequina pelophila TaxID=1638984 RepID=UPI000781CE90|nr:metal ABC transporter substrate-binding protein [Demequina pelophila]
MKIHQFAAGAAFAGAAALALAACTPEEGSLASAVESAASSDDAGLTIAAAFYPLEYVANAVAGDAAAVVGLTQPGVEPHDAELSPAAVRELGSADLVLYLSEFSAAIDDAIVTTGAPSLDVADVVALHPYGHDHGDEEDHADEDHADEDAHDEDAHDDHDHGDTDPHFWLDPDLFAEYAHAVAEQLGELDPDNAAAYETNAQAFEAQLTALDEEYATGLAQCERDTIVVAHEAFGYLTERYGLQQEGFAGVSPDQEPSPARLLQIKEIITETGATVIFTEDKVSSRVAEAIAEDVGVETRVLNPAETVTDGEDYASVMATNLAELRIALGCA